jgi:hypothetical protein
MNSNGASGVRVGVDIGGTFTDLVILTPDGRLEKRKIPSTPEDYAEAIIAGICDALAGADGKIDTPISEIVHATTIATNAILERANHDQRVSRCLGTAPNSHTAFLLSWLGKTAAVGRARASLRSEGAPRS